MRVTRGSAFWRVWLVALVAAVGFAPRGSVRADDEPPIDVEPPTICEYTQGCNYTVDPGCTVTYNCSTAGDFCGYQRTFFLPKQCNPTEIYQPYRCQQLYGPYLCWADYACRCSEDPERPGAWLCLKEGGIYRVRPADGSCTQ